MPSNKNQAEFSGQWGWMVRHRMRVMWWALAALLTAAVLFGWQPHGIWPATGRALLAAALICLGMGLRSWAAGVIHKDGQLATSGPYALSRHPLYVGSSLTIVGLGLVASGGFGLVGLLLAAALYLPTLRNEERVLAELFGESWQAYCQRTAPVGPKTAPQLSAKWCAKQWWANSEYELWGVLVVLIAGLQFWASR